LQSGKQTVLKHMFTMSSSEKGEINIHILHPLTSSDSCRSSQKRSFQIHNKLTFMQNKNTQRFT